MTAACDPRPLAKDDWHCVGLVYNGSSINAWVVYSSHHSSFAFVLASSLGISIRSLLVASFVMFLSPFTLLAD
jgi:hypothetical protein